MKNRLLIIVVIQILSQVSLVTNRRRLTRHLGLKHKFRSRRFNTHPINKHITTHNMLSQVLTNKTNQNKVKYQIQNKNTRNQTKRFKKMIYWASNTLQKMSVGVVLRELSSKDGQSLPKIANTAMTQRYRKKCTDIQNPDQCYPQDGFFQNTGNPDYYTAWTENLGKFIANAYDSVFNSFGQLISGYDPTIVYENLDPKKYGQQAKQEQKYCQYQKYYDLEKNDRKYCRCKVDQKDGCITPAIMFEYELCNAATCTSVIEKRGQLIGGYRKCDAQYCNTYAKYVLQSIQNFYYNTIGTSNVRRDVYPLVVRVHKILMFTIGWEPARDYALAMAYEDAQDPCLIGRFDNAKCREEVAKVLKQFNKTPDQSIQEVNNGLLQSNFISMLPYYHKDIKYDPQQLKDKKGQETYQYFCPFVKSEVNIKGQCACKQKRTDADGLCQMMMDWDEQDETKSKVINYLLVSKDNNQGQEKTKGEKGDNWLTGVKNCNDLNCDEYAKILINGIGDHIDRKNGLDKSEEKEVIQMGEKKPEEQKSEDECLDDYARRFRKRRLRRRKSDQKV